jgi:hypothetical protein
MRTQTRDEQTKRAESTENMDEEGRKHALTGDEEGLQRESAMWWEGRTMNFHVGKFKIQDCHMVLEF